ncbi:MAG TPA: hypothetical protein VFM55_19235 [Micromonosporaceae bacterium]|nr:hypothetical protein [Micromonosporaceae bacterium]
MGKVRIDDAWYDDPRVAAAGLECAGLFMACLTWAARHRRTSPTPGVVPADVVARFAGVAVPKAQRLARRLRDAGLFDDATDAGWPIHDFEGYLTRHTSEHARTAGSLGGQARAKQNAKQDAKQNAKQLASKTPSKMLGKSVAKRQQVAKQVAGEMLGDSLPGLADAGPEPPLTSANARRRANATTAADAAATTAADAAATTMIDSPPNPPLRNLPSEGSDPSLRSGSGSETSLRSVSAPTSENAEPAAINAGIVVGAWVDAVVANGVRPSPGQRGQVGQLAAQLLAAGNDPGLVLAAAQAAGAKGYATIDRELTVVAARRADREPNDAHVSPHDPVWGPTLGARG